MPWREVQNDPLVIDSLLPEIAHEMYPELFKTPDRLHHRDRATSSASRTSASRR